MLFLAPFLNASPSLRGELRQARPSPSSPTDLTPRSRGVPWREKAPGRQHLVSHDTVATRQQSEDFRPERRVGGEAKGAPKVARPRFFLSTRNHCIVLHATKAGAGASYRCTLPSLALHIPRVEICETVEAPGSTSPHPPRLPSPSESFPLLPSRTIPLSVFRSHTPFPSRSTVL